MAIASLFRSSTRDLVESFQRNTFKNPEERRAALEELAGSTSLKTADAVGLLFCLDGEARKAAGKLLAGRRDPETVALFVAALKGKPDAARRAAIQVLASLGLAGMPQQMGALLEQGELETRKLAADAILELPLSGDTVPLLVKIVERGEAMHRLKAVSRFASVADARYIPFFERLVEDPDERIRQTAWQVLVRLATPAHLDLFLRKVGDEPYTVQQTLIQGIQKLAPDAGPQVVEQVLGLLASGSTGLRTAALKILMSMPDRTAVVRRFIAYARTLAGWVRDRALESLRAFGPDLVDPALELLRDPDPEVRSAALTLLSSFDDPRVGAEAARLLTDPDWWLALNATDVLGRVKDPAHVPALIQALGRDEVRWAAVDALGHIGGPQAIEALSRLLEDPRIEIRIEAVAALALAAGPAAMPRLKQVASSDPAKVVRSRTLDLLRELALKSDVSIDESGLRSAANALGLSPSAPYMHRLLAHARKLGASDLHVSVGETPLLRINGTMSRMEGEPLDETRTGELLNGLLLPEQRKRLAENRQLDACIYVENDGRYRVNMFLDRKGLNGVFRVIPEQPPTVADLGLPPDVAEVASVHQGIIIVTGPSGCGKSTTLAALVNLVNETRRAHVLTLEDPVEFVHPFKSSLINQRDVGKHTASYARALRAALREDPDVIVIGELRDPETVILALTAAETGHVVLTTLNATTAAKAVDRVIGSFPADEQPQVRESFGGSLRLVLAQALVPRADGQGRVGCFEILKCTPAVANLIREGKTYQLNSVMQIGQSQGMRTFDEALMQLVREGKVSPETAYLRAHVKEPFESLVPPKFLEEVLA